MKQRTGVILTNSVVIHAWKTNSIVTATRQKHQLSPTSSNSLCEKTDIKQAHEHRVLGVIVDAEIKWQPQLNNLCKLVSKNLFLFSQLGHWQCKCYSTYAVFNAHISSHINCAGGCSEVHLKLFFLKKILSSSSRNKTHSVWSICNHRWETEKSYTSLINETTKIQQNYNFV